MTMAPKIAPLSKPSEPAKPVVPRTRVPTAKEIAALKKSLEKVTLYAQKCKAKRDREAAKQKSKSKSKSKTERSKT